MGKSSVHRSESRQPVSHSSAFKLAVILKCPPIRIASASEPAPSTMCCGHKSYTTLCETARPKIPKAVVSLAGELAKGVLAKTYGAASAGRPRAHHLRARVGVWPSPRKADMSKKAPQGKSQRKSDRCRVPSPLKETTRSRRFCAL